MTLQAPGMLSEAADTQQSVSSCAGYIHTATLTKLKPSTQYYYTYGDALFEFSQEHLFRTAPAVGSDATLHMLVNADMVRLCLRSNTILLACQACIADDAAEARLSTSQRPHCCMPVRCCSPAEQQF